MHGEDHVDGSLSANGVALLHVPASNDLEKYDTSDKAVQAWLGEVVGIFERDDLRLPVLVHCRSGKDRTGVVVAALLSILGVPEALIRREFMLSDGTEESNLSRSLAGIRKAGGVHAYFRHRDLECIRARLLGSCAAAGAEGLDRPAVRRDLADASATTAATNGAAADDEAEVRWLQDEVQLMGRLARENASKHEGEEAHYWYEEVASASEVLGGLLPPSDAAAALYYRGWALRQLGRPEESCDALTIGLTLARCGEAKAQVVKKLEKEMSSSVAALEEEGPPLQVVPLAEAADVPGDAHGRAVLLALDGAPPQQRWRSLPCPAGFSWLRCGELAAAGTPEAQHLPALQALGLSSRVAAAQLGAPKPAEEHLKDVVGQLATALASGAGCLVHCADGFINCSAALACFLVVHGLDGPVVADKPGQPKMCAGEAVEVLRAMRPGSLADREQEEEVHLFAKAAWGGHVERVQRAFSGAAAATTASPASKGASGGASAPPPSRKKAPPTARVVKQPGDGNCLFHSLAFGLGGYTAATLRAEICSFMERNPELSIAGTSLAEWIQMLAGSPVAPYAKKMAKSATWGGAPEIAACAHMSKVNVHVYEKQPGGTFELTVPFDVGSSTTITVLYVGGVHYDGLVL